MSTMRALGLMFNTQLKRSLTWYFLTGEQTNFQMRIVKRQL